MRCYICNKQLTDKEVVYNPELGHDEPCTTCLDVALDAAYSGGFTGDDEDKYMPSISDDLFGEDEFEFAQSVGGYDNG